MRTWILSAGIFILTALIFGSCSNSVDNIITFTNTAEGDVSINFRGSMISVPSGQTAWVRQIPEGTYNYATNYSIPPGTLSAATQGNTDGTIKINATTKILFVYSSTLLNGTYTLFVTISDSDTQSSSSRITGP